MTWLLLQQQITSPRFRLEGIRSEFERRSQDVESWTNLLIVVFVGSALTLLAWGARDLYGYYRRRQERNPRRLFREALRYLGLPRADRRLLRRVARQLRLAEPVRILMTAATFRQATEHWLAERAPSWEVPHARARFASLLRVVLPNQVTHQDDESPTTR